MSGEANEDDILTFTPQQGFVGSDMVTLHMTYPWGSEATLKLTLTWKIEDTLSKIYLPMTSKH